MRPTEFVTGEARLSYPSVFKPSSNDKFGGEPKYQTDVLIPKTDTATLQRLQEAFAAAVDLGSQTKWPGKSPKLTVMDVLKDGDEKGDDNYAGCWYLTPKSNEGYAPEIVDNKGNPIINQTEIYGGVYARVLINFFTYNFNNMRQGVSCSLGAIQKLRDGDSFGGGRGTSAANAFGFAPTPELDAAFAAVDPITGLPL